MTHPESQAELLPCPFCGGPVKLELCHQSNHEIYGVRNWWGVTCRNTMNRGGTCAIEQIPSASKEASTERWNRRAALPPVAAVPMTDDEIEALVPWENGPTISTDPYDVYFSRIKFARAIEARCKAVAAVPGWKLVPIEPTEAMHAAAVRTIIRCTGNDDFPPRIYRAMLAAAPQPPEA